MLAILGITFPIFAAIAIGFGLARTGFLTPPQTGLLSKFVINVALPPLIFNAVASRPIAEVFSLPFMVTMFLGGLATLAVSFLWFSRTGPMRRAVALMGSVVPNSAFVGFPLMTILFPGDAGVILSMNFLIENVVFIPLLLVAIEMARGAEGSGGVKLRRVFLGVLRRPMIIGLILGVVFSTLGLSLPEPLHRLTTMFANSASALALVVIGASLAGLATTGNRAMGAQIAAMKLIVHPLMVALVAWALVALGLGLDADVRAAAIISAAVPSFAIYTVLVSGTRHEGLASLALLIGTVTSFVTLNVLLAVLL
ncbi:AEC family transporter [Maritimibacter sp. DP1N21-5]|uniref:AEC family transporter n=1 Tax=Maritimibacter sp. DP1N21-5 TaxID=2836867 RepID=UPI001C48F83D|nr:AEC family transporter [Maritimibacter sp. DP1N21-5]MBV7410912.1 AEC family transporter [Maritimibacter sp. DP1N21-5]